MFNITGPTKFKDKLLLDKSDRDKISSLPIVEPFIDSWENPILQVVVVFIIFHRIDFAIADLQGWSSGMSTTTTFWVLEVKPRPNLSDLYGIFGSCPQIVHPPSSITALASFKDDILSGGLLILGT